MRTPSSLKILVIDDSRTIRRTAEVLLKKENFTVETAEDGFDALPKMVKYQPDLIFVDIMMPRLDGYQTCSLIKNNPKLKNAAVVMLSSKDGLFDKAKGRIVGATEYVTKPFTKEDLFSVIQKIYPDIVFSGPSSSNESAGAGVA